MNAESVSRFQQVEAQLEGLHTEVSLLSKSKPNDAINKFKIRFVNLVLSSANELLDVHYRPFPDFELFSEDELPTNSDVVLILSQYRHSLEKLRSDNIKQSSGFWYWITEGKLSDIRTKSPKRI